MPDEKRLGRGLASLLGRVGSEAEPGAPLEPANEIAVDLIRPNPMQPREVFDEDDLIDLVESIRANGMLQPVIVRKSATGYELVAGERRWQAAKRAGLTHLPAIVRDVGDHDMLSLALIENLQRVNLNPIETARAFRDLMARYSLTQDEAAKRIGKNRATVANILRLLDLPESIQAHVSRGTISMGHARALLAVKHTARQLILCNRIIDEGLSVRQVEQAASPAPKKTTQAKPKNPDVRDLEARLRERLGAKVEVAKTRRGGKLIIHYADNDDLARLLDILGL